MATETRTHKTKASAIARLPAKAASPAELAQARQASPVDVLGRVMAASASAINPDDLRALQRTIGNRAVNQLIQAKLSVGPAGDRYEQEADRVAQQVVGRINHPVDQAAGPTHSVQRAKRDEEDSQMQAGPGSLLRRDISDVGGLRLKPHSRRQSDGDQDTLPDLESSIQRARGNGHPLADRIRAPMEQALGADFSRVKIHTDARSDKLNRSIQARAFTTGQDVFVRPDEYNPGSRAGQELIAHELTHVVQQNGSVVRRASQSIGRADSAAIQRKPVKDP